MTIETLRLPTSEYFIERVKRKDRLEDPCKLDSSRIDFVVDPRLIGEKRYKEEHWFTSLPIIIDENPKFPDKSIKYSLGVYLIKQPRTISTDDLLEYPHILFDLTQLKDDKVLRIDRKSYEVQFYPIDRDNDLRPWLSIFRREMFGSSTRVKSPIELGYEKDNHIYGMAIIVLPNEGLNTRFVYISGNEIQYSSQQAFTDDTTGK